MKGLGSLYVRNTNSPVEGKQQCWSNIASQQEKGYTAGGKEEKPELTVLNTASLKALGKVRQRELRDTLKLKKISESLKDTLYIIN